MEDGIFDEAVVSLKRAVADRPVSQIFSEGEKTYEYLPYLMLGVCYYEMGKHFLAGEYFELEYSLPALSVSGRGQKLMQEYQAKLQGRTQESQDSEAERTIRTYRKKAYLLEETDVKRIKNEIRTRCNLPPGDESSYPWYYHYELGLAMSKKSDWQRALDSFISALDHREKPQKFTRLYGMWFIDYYPYFNIGMAHYYLGNWKCATSSFRLSQMLEDIPAGSASALKLQQYQLEAQDNLTSKNSNK